VYLSKIKNSTVRFRKLLENKAYGDDEKAMTLEKQLTQAQLIAEEANKRYDEVCTNKIIIIKRFAFVAFWNVVFKLLICLVPFET